MTKLLFDFFISSSFGAELLSVTKKSATFHSNFAYTCEKLSKELKKLHDKQRTKQKQVKSLILCPIYSDMIRNFKNRFSFVSYFLTTGSFIKV